MHLIYYLQISWFSSILRKSLTYNDVYKSGAILCDPGVWYFFNVLPIVMWFYSTFNNNCFCVTSQHENTYKRGNTKSCAAFQMNGDSQSIVNVGVVVFIQLIKKSHRTLVHR